MSNAIRVLYEPLRSLAFGGISGAYAGVGASFAHPVRILKVTNTTDAALLISFDGSTNHDVVAASSAWIHDYSANREANGDQLDQAQGTRIYVKQVSAPTLGTVYVTVIGATSI